MKTSSYICTVIFIKASLHNVNVIELKKKKMKNLNLYSFCNWSSFDGQGLYVNFLSGGTEV